MPHSRARSVEAPLLWASLFALPTAALAPVSLPVAALLAMLGLAFALGTRHPCRLAGLCALPALLAAIEAPAPPIAWPRAGPVAIDGIVDDVVRIPRTGTLLVRLGPRRGDLRVQFDTDFEVLPGDRLQATGRVGAPAAPDLPPSLHGAAATARVTAGPWSLRRAAATARRAMERQLLRLVPGEHGAMLASLVLGRGTLASLDVTAAHQATGLSHLLAVSGAHAAMLALLLGLRARGHRLAAGWGRTTIVLSLLFAYAAVTGNEPPVLRAVVTFVLAAIGSRLGRPLGLTAGLAAPAIVTCLLQPEALLGPSFLLSYAAVIGLCVAGPPTGEPGLRRWLLGALRSSFWAALLTAPLTLYFFSQAAPWTVVLTPLLAPLVAAMLLSGLGLAMLGCMWPDLAAVLAVPIELATRLYTAAVHAADTLPGTPIHAVCTPPAWALGLACAAAVMLVAHRPTRRNLTAGVALAMAPHFVLLHTAGEATFRLCAVGHGQAALLRTASGHQTAIDCGSLQHPHLAARRLMAALVRRRVDLLVVTHADQDHHNGIVGLLKQVPVTAALLPASLEGSPVATTLADHGTEVHFLAPGESSEPAPHLRMAAPSLPATASDNDKSAWVTARLGPVTVLLTGDAEALGTAAALAEGLAVPCDVLVLPHHGRPNPMAARLLQVVRPVVAFASADAADGETALGPLARAFGADLWVTGQHGDLQIHAGTFPWLRASTEGRPLRRPP